MGIETFDGLIGFGKGGRDDVAFVIHPRHVIITVRGRIGYAARQVCRRGGGVGGRPVFFFTKGGGGGGIGTESSVERCPLPILFAGISYYLDLRQREEKHNARQSIEFVFRGLKISPAPPLAGT